MEPTSCPASLQFQLVVEDEAHHTCKCKDFMRMLKTMMEKSDCVLCLADTAQSTASSFDTLTGDMTQVNLTEVVRSTQRIVSGAMSFQMASYKMETVSHVHHEGPPLRTYIFPPVADPYAAYVTETVRALTDICKQHKDLSLHNRLAILVPDEAFKTEYVPRLEKALASALGTTQLQVRSSCEALKHVAHKAQSSHSEWIIRDTLEAFDGLEKWFIFMVAMGQSLATSDSVTEHERRSCMYRGLTRAQWQGVVINEHAKEAGSSF